MNKLKDFFKSKAFYIAFGTGILAFSGLLLMYNYSDNREGLQKEQAIDLNQPVVEDTGAETDNYALGEATEDILQPVESDGVLTGEDLEQSTEENILEDNQGENLDSSIDTATASDGEYLDENGTAGETTEESEETVDVVADGSGNSEDIASGYSYDGSESLTWPLNGNIILPYSMDTTVYYATLGSYKCNPGMLIAGEEGADVVAAYDGVVEDIVEDKEHGTTVIINMGNGYVTSYGQLMNISVGVGDSVMIGENIGEVAPVTSYYTEEGTHLYFQMTKDGAPVNPLNYIQ